MKITNLQSGAAAAFGLALLVAAGPALAAVSGGIDPVSGLTRFSTYALQAAGVIIPLICVGKGMHAVMDGRHLGPYIYSAIGGMVLAFGGAYILTHYGVT